MGNSALSRIAHESPELFRVASVVLDERELESLEALPGLSPQASSVSACKNAIRELPSKKELARWATLRELRLDGNRVTKVPRDVAQLAGLQLLSLCDNRVAAVDAAGLAALPQLAELWLSHNLIDDLSFLLAGGGDHHHHHHHHHHHDKQQPPPSPKSPPQSPKGTQRFGALRVLHLDNNPIRRLPEGVLAGLPALTALSLASCQLGDSDGGDGGGAGGEGGSDTAKDRNLAELFAAPRLQQLDVSGNGLAELPEALRTAVHLQELRAGGNRLQQLPLGLAALVALQRLVLRDNAFTQLPEALTDNHALAVLDLANNRLAALPASLGNMAGLTVLQLDGNCLTALPPSIGRLTRLARLSLTGNQLHGLPHQLVQLAGSLTEVVLDDNPPLGKRLRRAYEKGGVPPLMDHLRRHHRKDMDRYVLTIQRLVRRQQMRRRFRVTVQRVMAAQEQARMVATYQRSIVERNAAVTIQLHVRQWLARRKWRAVIESARRRNTIDAGSAAVATATTATTASTATTAAAPESAAASRAQLRQMRLERVKTHSRGLLQLPDAEADSSSIRWLQDDKHPEAPAQVHAATLEQLVRRTTDPARPDAELVADFLATVGTFDDLEIIFEMFVLRFVPPESEAADADADAAAAAEAKRRRVAQQLLVLQLLQRWLEQYPEDFVPPSPLATRAADFFDSKPVTERFRVSAKALHELLDSAGQRRQLQALDLFELLSRAPTSMLPSRGATPAEMERHQMEMDDFDAVEVARQLTLIESNLFRAIKRCELYGGAWNKKGKESAAPHVLALIERFNSTAGWLQDWVLEEANVKKRVKRVAFLIAVALECRRLLNFNSLMQIITALGSSAISRLRMTWAALPAKTTAAWEELQNGLNMIGNYKVYRAAIAALDGSLPVVPFVGLFLADLTFVEETANVIDGLPNFSKRRQMAVAIRKFVALQHSPYCIASVPYLQARLLRAATVAAEAAAASTAAAAAAAFVGSAAATATATTDPAAAAAATTAPLKAAPSAADLRYERSLVIEPRGGVRGSLIGPRTPQPPATTAAPPTAASSRTVEAHLSDSCAAVLASPAASSGTASLRASTNGGAGAMPDPPGVATVTGGGSAIEPGEKRTRSNTLRSSKRDG